MAFVQAVASDLTGAKGEPEEFGKLTVRGHPSINGTAKVLDVKPEEVQGLKQVGDVVFLDYQAPGTEQETTLVVSRKDFDALAKTGQDMTTILAAARGVRGRPRAV